jgi:hypothetical protein
VGEPQIRSRRGGKGKKSCTVGNRTLVVQPVDRRYTYSDIDGSVFAKIHGCELCLCYLDSTGTRLLSQIMTIVKRRKGKAIPVTGRGGCEMSKLPHFLDIVSQMAARLSALRSGRSLPPGIFLIFISLRGVVDPGAVVRLEGLGQLKKSNNLNGNRTHNLPACTIVPQPSTIPRAPIMNIMGCILVFAIL